MSLFNVATVTGLTVSSILVESKKAFEEKMYSMKTNNEFSGAKCGFFIGLVHSATALLIQASFGKKASLLYSAITIVNSFSKIASNQSITERVSANLFKTFRTTQSHASLLRISDENAKLPH